MDSERKAFQEIGNIVSIRELSNNTPTTKNNKLPISSLKKANATSIPTIHNPKSSININTNTFITPRHSLTVAKSDDTLKLGIQRQRQKQKQNSNKSSLNVYPIKNSLSPSSLSIPSLTSSSSNPIISNGTTTLQLSPIQSYKRNNSQGKKVGGDGSMSKLRAQLPHGLLSPNRDKLNKERSLLSSKEGEVSLLSSRESIKDKHLITAISGGNVNKKRGTSIATNTNHIPSIRREKLQSGKKNLFDQLTRENSLDEGKENENVKQIGKESINMIKKKVLFDLKKDTQSNIHFDNINTQLILTELQNIRLDNKTIKEQNRLLKEQNLQLQERQLRIYELLLKQDEMIRSLKNESSKDK
ncbi:hypothetical protein TBLA_0H01360 [Henningerozyma blattae CBS 6284]|uniref:Uncharacterized protein n=1 Tax=Henningerozyma blattae (strain ATCC 34711 / CBS 6284 / DSM 70876 / NBRC 10599 / NRRL Y-10934 / UCD 77-7) TaxID=1071380 RepID=I2H7S1_HENB6|nr:hypothetical protein TBLA_0H01360 [Tetrapisispora blattae CBS 6284]CCH62423.1 hypothetical protein TBLA_0H01360 [Tetrapisispora blattae CBS 6284]